MASCLDVTPDEVKESVYFQEGRRAFFDRSNSVSSCKKITNLSPNFLRPEGGPRNRQLSCTSSNSSDENQDEGRRDSMRKPSYSPSAVSVTSVDNTPRNSIFLEVPPVYTRQNSATSQECLIEDANQLSIQMPAFQGTFLPGKFSIAREKLRILRRNIGGTFVVLGLGLLVIGILVFLIRFNLHTKAPIPSTNVVPVKEANITTTAATNSTSTTTTSAPGKATKILTIEIAHSPQSAIGSIMMGGGCLLIFIGLSIILAPKLKPLPVVAPMPKRPLTLNLRRSFRRRVSTIEDPESDYSRFSCPPSPVASNSPSPLGSPKGSRRGSPRGSPKESPSTPVKQFYQPDIFAPMRNASASNESSNFSSLSPPAY